MAKESKLKSFERKLNRESSSKVAWHYVDRSFKVSVGDVTPIIGNSDLHEHAKFAYALDLKRNGEEIATEVRLIDESGKPCGKCDILSFTRGEIVEIIESESQKSMLLKENKYPLPVTFVKAEDALKCLFNQIEVRLR